MAFHLPFSYKRRYLPQTEVQNDFSGGMIRDVPPHEIPLNASYYLNDFLIDQHGKLYQRGPFGALNSTTPAWGAGSLGHAPMNIFNAYYPTATSNNSITFAVTGNDDHLYYSLGGATTVDKGAASWFTAGYVAQWAFYIDKTYASTGSGTAPKYITWTGTTATVATLSGAPNITTIGLYKSRIIGGIGNRLYFSDVPDPTTAWDTTNSWIDCEHAISQLVGLRNVLLVFSANGVERIIGDTPPPNSNMDRTTISNIGLGTAIDNGQKPVAVWNDNAIYANDQGVFITNGNAPVDLTVKGGISTYYRAQMATSNIGAGGISLGVYRNYLLVSGLSGAPILVYDLLRNAWSTIGNGNGPGEIRYMTSAVIGSQDDLLIANPFNTQILRVSNVFAPSTSAYTETALDTANGVLQPHLTTRAYTGSGITNRKRFSYARLSHDLHDPSALNPTWSVVATPGLAQETTPKTTVTLNETTKVQRSKVNIASESMGMQLDIKLTNGNTAALADIYAVEVEAASLPFDFEGST